MLLLVPYLGRFDQMEAVRTPWTTDGSNRPEFIGPFSQELDLYGRGRSLRVVPAILVHIFTLPRSLLVPLLKVGHTNVKNKNFQNSIVHIKNLPSMKEVHTYVCFPQTTSTCCSEISCLYWCATSSAWSLINAGETTQNQEGLRTYTGSSHQGGDRDTSFCQVLVLTFNMKNPVFLSRW